MELEISYHARLRIERRQLDLHWLEQVVCNPEWHEVEPADPALERRFGRIAEMGGRVLRVVIRPITPAKCRVITAFFDRGARSRNRP